MPGRIFNIFCPGRFIHADDAAASVEHTERTIVQLCVRFFATTKPLAALLLADAYEEGGAYKDRAHVLAGLVRSRKRFMRFSREERAEFFSDCVSAGYIDSVPPAYRRRPRLPAPPPVPVESIA
jgi:hypothetical protein